MIPPKPLPPLEVLQRLFKICNTSPSGLHWRVARSSKSRVKPGQIAGSLQTDGYWKVSLRLDGKSQGYLAHRLVYFLQTGVDPGSLRVDHVNGLRDPLTLRLATHAENQRNQSACRGGTSCYKGVSWNKQSGKWQVYITKDGKNKNLGYFVSEKKAAAAYNVAAVKVFGEFAKINEIVDLE